MFSDIFKIYIKVIKNKKFTYYFAIFSLLFITFILSNQDNEFVQGLRFILDFEITKLLVLLKIIIVSYYNLPLGMLIIVAFSVLYTIDTSNTETFDNIPNLVDKNKILKYNKNFKNAKKIVENKKEEVKEVEQPEKEEKNIKVARRKSTIASTDFFNEKRNNSVKEKNVEEVNLDETEDTIEKELKSKMSHEYKKLDEYDSSSSESSNSESSNSSTDSSDSEKEIEEVSMNKAREHMLNSLRSSLKKRYLND
jgi:hypothetical protein